MFYPYEEIKRTNLYEEVADKIEYLMIDGTLQVGTKLPSEQTMADNFHVSRNVVREAYKTLRERGLILLKNGEGAYVVQPEPSMVSTVLQRMLALKSVDFNDLYELRNALEENACKLFIRNITDEKLNTLKNIYNEMKKNMDNKEVWVQLDLDFHRYIVKATDNEVFYNFYKPILAALRYIFTSAWEVPGAKEKGLHAHEMLLNAFKAGDEKAAADCMEKHLSDSLYDINYFIKNQ